MGTARSAAGPSKLSATQRLPRDAIAPGGGWDVIWHGSDVFACPAADVPDDVGVDLDVCRKGKKMLLCLPTEAARPGARARDRALDRADRRPRRPRLHRDRRAHD